MDTFMGLVLVVALLIWGVPRLGRAFERATRRRPVPRSVVQRARPHPEVTRRRANAQARAFQIALIQLAQAPDFRRASTLVAAATLVPATFRRRQFTRFRPQLVAHFRRCIAAGTDRDVLLPSLRDLVSALGVAVFEADYIQQAAERRAPESRRVVSAADRMAALRQEHEARLAAIRQEGGEDSDLREQLLEAETQRFREALLAVVDSRTGGTAPGA